MACREGEEPAVPLTMMMKAKLNTIVMKNLTISVREQGLNVLEQWKHNQSQRRDRKLSKNFRKRMM